MTKEIFPVLAPEYWRQGLMAEAMKTVIHYGFHLPQVHRIEAFIDPDNEGSRRLLLKSGFTEEGHLRDYFMKKASLSTLLFLPSFEKNIVRIGNFTNIPFLRKAGADQARSAPAWTAHL